MAFWTFLIILICEIFCLLWETLWLPFFFPVFLPPSLSLSPFFLSSKRNQLLSRCKICMCCLLHNFEFEMASFHEKFIKNSNTQHLKNIFLNTTVELDCMTYNLQAGNWNKFQRMFLNTQALGPVTGNWTVNTELMKTQFGKVSLYFHHLLRSCAKSIKWTLSFDPHNHSKK